jgi:class 3 adenylate cyclase
MASTRGKKKKIALLQISIRNISYLEENLSSSELIDMINKVYEKIKTVLKDKDAYLYKMVGENFYIIMDDLENDTIKKENTFYLAKDILEKLKNYNKFLKQHHIPKLEYSMALDYGDVFVGKVKYEEKEQAVIIGTPFKNTNRAIALNEKFNITPLLLTNNIYNEIKHILTEYIISVMGYIKTDTYDLYLYGSYQFNK